MIVLGPNSKKCSKETLNFYTKKPVIRSLLMDKPRIRKSSIANETSSPMAVPDFSLSAIANKNRRALGANMSIPTTTFSIPSKQPNPAAVREFESQYFST